VKKQREYIRAWPPIEPPELRGAYVGFWARFWASFLDTILIVIVTYPFLIAAYGWAYLDSWSLVEGPIDFLLSWIFPAAAIIVFWMYRSATPGKMAIGAIIVDAATGRQPTQWQLVKRYVGYLFSSIPLCWGFIHIAFDPRKQGWHDKFAKTVVVYAKKVHQPEMAPKAKSLFPEINQPLPSLGSPPVMGKRPPREEVFIGASQEGPDLGSLSFFYPKEN